MKRTTAAIKLCGMSTATDMRDAYIAAEVAVLKGQSYRFGERQLTRVDLQEIRAGRKEWEQRASEEAARAGGLINPGVALADFSGEGYC